MAFIDKKNPVVLNIKLTSKGRELLSEGRLTFDYFTIGDSEIDYNFNTTTGFDPFYSKILRPMDKNPSILSFISKDLTGDTYNAITNVPSTPTIIQNTATPLGFFTIETGSTTFITDSDHIKQPDAMIVVSGVTGGKALELFQAPTYLANVNEPAVGDYILVKWTNPYGVSTTGYTVNKLYPTPYLVYKIQAITSGALSSNNLVVTVDRDLPDFSQPTGGTGSTVAGALVYYNYDNFTGSTENIYDNYASEYVTDSVIAFLENCQCPTITFPFWNLSIIHTEEIAGVQSSDRTFGDFKSRTYAGFVSYIQNQSPTLKRLGVIHYTNTSPSNTYAEELYQNTPVLNIPTVMWHKSAGNEMGITLSAYGNVKTLTGSTKSLNTTYYDLADESNTIVGKIFNDLKLFVIEDQELLFAMSYKSNRSWTLPDYNVGINDNVIIGCLESEIEFDLSGTSLTSIGAADGTLTVYNIVNYVGQMILQVSGSTVGEVYLGTITGTTQLINLSGDTYTAKILDTAAINSNNTGQTITIGAANIETGYTLSMYAAATSESSLIPNFTMTRNGYSEITILKTDIGTVYGTGATTPAVGYKLWGADDATITWIPFGLNDSVTISGVFSYTTAYQIYAKDYIDYLGAPFEFTVFQDYVAVGTPFETTFTTAQGNDGEAYLTASNYLTTIDDNSNRIIGDIEFALYSNATNAAAPVWETLDTGATLGSAKRFNIDNYATGSYTVAIREKILSNDGTVIEVASVEESITIT